MKVKIFSTGLKGLAIGGSMLVPGVSGGTMAIILGIYDKLISSISSFFKDIKHNTLFLLFFCIGAVVGMLLFAKPILFLIDHYPFPMLYFFIGCVAGGVPLIFKEAKVKQFSAGTCILSLLFIAIGIAIVVGISLLSSQGFKVSADHSWFNVFMLVVAGIVVAVALVLPGISASYMLLVLGMYDVTMKAMTGFEFSYIIPLGIGCLLGIVLTTKILEYCMKKHPFSTYLIILGFIIGSIAEIFPGIPQGINWLLCPVLFIVGFIVIHMLTKLEMKAS